MAREVRFERWELDRKRRLMMVGQLLACSFLTSVLVPGGWELRVSILWCCLLRFSTIPLRGIWVVPLWPLGQPWVRQAGMPLYSMAIYWLPLKISEPVTHHTGSRVN